IPEWVASLIGQLDAPGWVLMLALAAGLLAIGTVMDGFSALIVFLPVLLPLGSLMGMEPIQMITFVNLALVLGVLTPPVGVCLFITSSIAGVDILKVARAAVPFVLVLTVVLLIVGFYQPMTMWLPSLGGGGSEEHTSELQSRENLVCRLLREKKYKTDLSSDS